MTATQPITSPGSESTTQKPVGDIFTLRAAFKNNDIIVPVANPYFRMKPVDGQDCIPFSPVGAMPLDASRTKWAMSDLGNNYYGITINPDGLAYGWYNVYFCGDYWDGTQNIRKGMMGTIEITELDRASHLCNTVLNRIADDDMESYLITAPRYHHFKSGSLMNLIPAALSYFNVTGPTRNDYTMNTLPADEEVFIVDYMIAQAMFQKARIAIDNDMYLADSKSLQQIKFEKYKSLYDTKIAELKAAIIDFKKANPAFGQFQRRSKYPVWVIYSGLSTGASSLFMGPFQSSVAGYF